MVPFESLPVGYRLERIGTWGARVVSTTTTATATATEGQAGEEEGFVGHCLAPSGELGEDGFLVEDADVDGEGVEGGGEEGGAERAAGERERGYLDEDGGVVRVADEAVGAAGGDGHRGAAADAHVPALAERAHH